MRLLEASSSRDYAGMTDAAKSLEYLIQLGNDVNLINPANTRVILREIGNLYSAIAEFDSATLPDLNLDAVFSKVPERLDREKKNEEIESKNGNSYEQNINKNGGLDNQISDFSKDREGEIEGEIEKGDHAQIRQSAILERIRQFGNCRLKEIQEFIPKVSERTLRYDLQDLVDQGLVERVGSGGPATFYRMRIML